MVAKCAEKLIRCPATAVFGLKAIFKRPFDELRDKTRPDHAARVVALPMPA